MDPTTPPWRTLEAAAAGSSASDLSGGPARSSPPAAPPRSPVSSRVLATLAGAAGFGVLAFVLAIGGGSTAEVVVDGGAPVPGTTGAAPSDPLAAGGAEAVLVVEVVGAVADPGVYRLPGGSRVGDLVGAAGGYGPRVDTVRAERELNLAAHLADGDQVRVPSRDDPPPAASSASTASGEAGADGPVDLNRATAAELDALPGIGPVTVEKIMAAREEAPFAAVEELRTRGLVGEKTFERIQSSLIVR